MYNVYNLQLCKYTRVGYRVLGEIYSKCQHPSNQSYFINHLIDRLDYTQCGKSSSNELLGCCCSWVAIFDRYFTLQFWLGAVHKWRNHLGGGGSAQRWYYCMSLFSKMVNKGEGGVKNLKKWVTSIMDGPLLELVFLVNLHATHFYIIPFKYFPNT